MLENYVVSSVAQSGGAPAVASDGHDKPFCTKAMTIIDNFKNALGDTDKSQFRKAISVIDKLSSINVAVNFQCV